MVDVIPITVAYGDGIGPELMDAVLLILKEAKAGIKIDIATIGEDLYKKGYESGISQDAWKVITKNNVFLKSPITTPQGKGYKSLNVTIRKLLRLYANVRPTKSLHPYVKTNNPEMDTVVIRENEEDLYAGVEYRQTLNMCHAIKLISRSGCEQIIRYAFEYAVANNRKKITCMSKDNIMKITDGLFHKVFDEIASEYPDINNEHYIIDIGTAKLASEPQNFDVIVTENLYGDIISDVLAEQSGSVGLSGSANIGNTHAMFEAIHGSAPKLAGLNTANPSGLLNAAIMMLVHIGQSNIASLIENAWLKTIEDGMHTQDIYDINSSVKKLGTKEFTHAVIERLGQNPSKLKSVAYKLMSHKPKIRNTTTTKTEEKKFLVGVDVFIDLFSNSPEEIGEKISKIADRELSLQFISFKGAKIWPNDIPFLPDISGDHWRLRFISKNKEKTTTHQEIIYLLEKLMENNIDFIKTENLYFFDNNIGFALAQGQ